MPLDIITSSGIVEPQIGQTFLFVRSRRTIRSDLSDIPGVGPKRQATLLRRFGSLKGVREATAEEIARVPGFSEALATRILTYLGR